MIDVPTAVTIMVFYGFLAFVAGVAAGVLVTLGVMLTRRWIRAKLGAQP